MSDFTTTTTTLLITTTLPMNKMITHNMIFTLFFSDGAKQHASTSFENMHKQFEHLQESGRLNRGKTTILDHTDGCSGQCRSALALHLMTVMAVSYGVVIDRMVNAPAHVKGLVDALNSVTKNS